MGPEKKAAHLLPHMSDVALKVGKDVIGYLGGVGQILNILRERFAPDAIDRIPKTR